MHVDLERRDRRPRIAMVARSAGDWGGASRVLFTNVRLLDRERFEPLVVLPHEGVIEATLRDLRIPYRVRPLHEPIGPVSFARDVLGSIDFLRSNRIDLLHFAHSGYWRPAEMLAARILRIPVLTHLHVVIEKPQPWLAWSRVLVAVSEFVARESLPRTAAKRVVYNAVDLPRFDSAREVREELGIPSSTVVVAFVGQLREIKGLDLFIRMARAVRCPNVAFVIAGECRDPAKFSGAYSRERLAAECGDDRRLLYVGYREDIESIYASADIVVVPSRWDEPFGLVNIEAGARRLPVIAASVGGIPEVISDGVNGFLVGRGDLDGLVQRLTRLIGEPRLRRRMGDAAREIVEKRFTSKPVRDLERLYLELLPGNARFAAAAGPST